MLFPKAPWNRLTVLPWVILAFSAMNVIFLGGKRRAFGGFVARMRKDYPNITLTELNWVGDSYAAVGYMTTGISISIILECGRRYGLFQFLGSVFVLASCLTSAVVPNPHWLFLTHTLLHGVGSSLILAVVGLIVHEHFPPRHPYHLLATTLVSGGSVASIVFVFVFAGLISATGWRMAFVVLGLLYFFITSISSIFFTKNDLIDNIGDSKRIRCDCRGSVTGRHIPLLLMWMMDRVMTSVVTYGLLLNLTDYEYSLVDNRDLVSSSILTTIFAAGEASTYLIGAIITALTRNFFKNRLKWILLVSATCMSVSLILLEFFRYNMVARRILCFISGFSLGPSITFLFPAGEELTRLPGHMAYPFSLGSMGLGMMISPLLTARIAEIYKYKGFFLVQGGLIGLKVLCLAMIIVLLYCCPPQEAAEQYDDLLNSKEDGDKELDVDRSESPTESSQLIKDDKQ